jgi:6-phosphofructokinase 1
MPNRKGNAIVGQSGGPTAVINQSLVGIIEACRREERIGTVLGMRNGVKGILEERLVDLSRETQETLEAVARTPSSALGSARTKPTEADCHKILEVLRAHDVRYFFYIGGNDSAEAAHLLDGVAQKESYELSLFHVPKTIDNDLMVTDHCPGYPSAARFVAMAMMGDDEDNRSLPGVKIDVIMGRHAGWLTAASLLAREREGDGPHLIYLPEHLFDVDGFLGDVEDRLARHGRCLVAVSEGIHDAAGTPVLETISKSKEVDTFGNVQLSGTGALGDLLAVQVKERLGKKLRVRADTFGYLQRSFFGVTSEVDVREAREVGRAAVRAATAGTRSRGSIAIVREGGREYRARYEPTELMAVAAQTRRLEPGHVAGTNDVSDAFRSWATPLVGELPRRGRLALVSVPKKL